MISIFCRVTVTSTAWDPTICSYFSQFARDLSRTEPSILSSLFTTTFFLLTPQRQDNYTVTLPYLQLLCEQLSTLLQDECEKLRKEFLQGDCTDDVASRLLRCGQVWQLLLQLQHVLLQVQAKCDKNDKSEKGDQQEQEKEKDWREVVETVMRSAGQLAKVMTDILMLVDVNARHGGYLWGYFIQLFLITASSFSPSPPSLSSSPSPSPLLGSIQPLRDFCRILFTRILQSPRLVLFDLPGINDGFRHNLTTSIHNSDHVLVTFFSLSSYSLVFEETNPLAFQKMSTVIAECLTMMPYRPLLGIGCFRLAMTLVEKGNASGKEMGRKVLKEVLKVGDLTGIATLFLVATVIPSSPALQTLLTQVAPSFLEQLFKEASASCSSSSSSSSLRADRCSCHQQILLLLARTHFDRMDETLRMHCLLYLENGLALTRGYSLSQPALEVLTTLAANELHQQFICSFTQKLIQKEWKKSPPYQAIFELVVALSPAQPLVFLAIATCCCLHGAVGKLTVLQQRLGALELASVQLYTLQETSYDDEWTVVLEDEFAQRLYLACLLQQVLYQVSE